MKKVISKTVRLGWKTAKWFLVLSIVSTILFRWLPIPFTPLMFTRFIDQKMEGKSLKLDKDWVSLDKISPNLQLAVVCSEDQNFLEHGGFDFKAIEKAQEYNETHEKTRGASTISQQTAKNVFLWQGRSWLRKGLEVYFTFLIEHIWSKERIMEVYLNVIEMGDGVYGAEAASQNYFKKNAANLSKVEAASIAAILPNPRVYSATKPGKYVVKKKNWIMRQMNNYGGILKY